MPSLFFYFFIFLFGLAIGSFLNCVIYWLESKKRKGLMGRSFCPHCGHMLGWQDLIPVLSFLLLKGKCRYCQKPISFQYPMVELATGFLFVSFFILHSSFFIYLISCFLIIIFVYDFKHCIIPDRIIYSAITITLLYQLIKSAQVSPVYFLDFILSAVGAAGFFLAIVLISRGKWMGLGDIKLAFLMGFLLGWPNILVALFLAFFIGAIIGIGLIVAGKKTLKSEVPFGPFLVIGTFLALFWGEQIMNWYFNLLIGR